MSPDTGTVSASRFEALLKALSAIAAHEEFGDLLDALGILLREVLEFDQLVLLLYDAETKEGWLYYAGASKERLTKVASFPFDEGPGLWVWDHQQPAVKTIADFKAHYPKVYPRRQRLNIQSSCTVPLTTVRRRLGALEFQSSKIDAYTPEIVHFIQLVASQVAVAIDNALIHARLKASEQSLAQERDHLRLLLEVNNTATSRLDPKELVIEVANLIEQTQGSEFCGLTLHAADSLRWECVHYSFGAAFIGQDEPISAADPVIARAFRERRMQTASLASPDTVTGYGGTLRQLRRAGLRSVCALPLIVRGGAIGVMVIGQRCRDTFLDEDLLLLKEITEQVSMSVGNALAYHEIEQLRDKLSCEKLYLEDEIKSQYNFGEIIGTSESLRSVLEQVQMVADSDTSVLILGETGTGKELIARAIHDLSTRKNHTLIKVNCAAIPANLLESDMFGHEKGAFTGAFARKIGRFELAHQGTIFLDEIGDIPLELQAKLLRALQEHEIERLGSSQPIRVDARVITATNRNLKEMVAERQFRGDLYYRLNVFPIYVPALRERREDIPLLVDHFVRKFSKKLGRDIRTVPSATMDLLMDLPWPGNVRELEHLIERAVVISRGSQLEVPLEPSQSVSMPPQASAPPALPAVFSSEAGLTCDVPKVTLDEVERSHILSVLRDTKGMVGGPAGAAAQLGIKRTTLISRMKKLGIIREVTLR